MLNPTPGNPLVYEDCNGDKPQILRNIYTGNPLVYKDCNRKDERDTADRRDWQPTCLRGLQPEKCTDACIRYKLATHLSTRIATTSSSDVFCTCNLATHLSTRIATEYKKYITRYTVTGNPLVYEDCNCKIFVICECYSTKDLLSYGGKCKKYLHGAKALNLIPITFYYRTNSP
ncbi:hypothetical protein RBATCC27255_01903 [Ruminococcus bromii]|uniref:Uncharacterized protein n=1 Tax=Ruminococcus bromii TaxID=40518 RepID=A0A2N0UJ72_9FIRM|nr:hypothetical protein RBATCC27255_01903 [Ruminococcus bromii]